MILYKDYLPQQVSLSFQRILQGFIISISISLQLYCRHNISVKVDSPFLVRFQVNTPDLPIIVWYLLTLCRQLGMLKLVGPRTSCLLIVNHVVLHPVGVQSCFKMS